MTKFKKTKYEGEINSLHDFKKKDISVVEDEILIKHKSSYYKFSKKETARDIKECRDLMLLVGLISFGVSLIAYLILGFVLSENSYGFAYFWMLFILIPISISVVEVIYRKQFVRFNMAALTALIYSYLGMFKNLWHPGWVVFIVAILYYIGMEIVDYKTGYKFLDEAIKVVDEERISKYGKEC